MSVEIITSLDNDDLDQKNKPYKPRNGLLDLFYSQRDEVLLSGPSGSGKTTACLNKCFMLCEQYPNLRVLFLRATRESVTQSMLAPFEDNVVPEGHPCLAGPSRETRKEYKFPNGSVIIIGGLRQSNKDQTQKIMGPNYDIAYIDEAIDLTQEQWEKVGTRLRNFKMPYQQLMATTNPSYPTHWLKKRSDSGVTQYIETYHRDNDCFFDSDLNEWKPAWESYGRKLANMTGVARDRFFLGRWVQAEGSVYPDFSHTTHVCKAFTIPDDWKKIRAIDFGYRDPFVCLHLAQNPTTKRIYVYREYVRTEKIVEDHARFLLTSENGEKITETVCDHDAEDRATIEKYLKCPTKAADKRKEKKFGIQAVQAAMRPMDDGLPGLMVFDSLYGQYDERMAEKRKPCGLLQEIDAYVWDSKKDKPQDGDDHSLDCLLYSIMYFNNNFEWLKPEVIAKPKVVPLFQRPKDGLNNLPQFRNNNPHPFGS